MCDKHELEEKMATVQEGLEVLVCSECAEMISYIEPEDQANEPKESKKTE